MTGLLLFSLTACQTTGASSGQVARGIEKIDLRTEEVEEIVAQLKVTPTEDEREKLADELNRALFDITMGRDQSYEDLGQAEQELLRTYAADKLEQLDEELVEVSEELAPAMELGDLVQPLGG